MQEDGFNFGEPPEAVSPEIVKLQHEKAELLVVIDTLQTNLRSAESVIKKYEPRCSLFKVPSYIWCSKWTDT